MSNSPLSPYPNVSKSFGAYMKSRAGLEDHDYDSLESSSLALHESWLEGAAVFRPGFLHSGSITDLDGDCPVSHGMFTSLAPTYQMSVAFDL